MRLRELHLRFVEVKLTRLPFFYVYTHLLYLDNASSAANSNEEYFFSSPSSSLSLRYKGEGRTSGVPPSYPCQTVLVKLYFMIKVKAVIWVLLF